MQILSQTKTISTISSTACRRCSQMRLSRPSLINIILVCLLLTVVATRKRLPLFEEAYHSYPYHRTQPIFDEISSNVRKTSQRMLLNEPSVPIRSNSVASTIVRYDSDLEATARRNRPMPSCVNQKKATSFLMLFMGHSGSSAILSEIRDHPDVHVETMELVDHQETINSTEAALTTRRFFEDGIKKGKVPGFKIRPNHILSAPELFQSIIKDFNTRIIWQYRQNIFKASVGEYAVRYLKDRRSIEGLRQNLTESQRCAHENGCSFKIQNVSFLHYILRNKVQSHNLITQSIYSMVNSTNNDCIREVPYEDYLHNREDTILDIFKFLGLPKSFTNPTRFKANSDNLCKAVENWQEVCHLFYGCITWQHMLDDTRNDCFCNSPGGPSIYCHSR